jgi:hypothetical protein
VNLFVQRAGLDAVKLNWQEQYYLNAGYQVYLDGKLLGQTPEARFPITGLEPQKTYTAQVKAVWETGHESPFSKELRFTLAALAPDELLLDEVEPERSGGTWRGYEIEELLAAPALTVAGKSYAHGLNAFAGAEMTYALHGLFATFTVSVGMDDRSPENSAAEFIVLGDGQELWRSPALKRSASPQLAKIAVQGVRQLMLKTITVEPGKIPGQADWLDPKLTKTNLSTRHESVMRLLLAHCHRQLTDFFINSGP